MREKKEPSLDGLYEGSVAWRLVHEDWSEYTIAEIAEEMGASTKVVMASIRRLRDVYGYEVKRASRRRHNRWSIPGQLLERDWSECTIAEIAEALQAEKRTVASMLSVLKREGHEVRYLHCRQGPRRAEQPMERG